jgi:hypothetical protein
MSAFANIVLNDGQATPVAHTFQPKTCIGTTALYEDRSSGIAVSYKKLQIDTKDTTNLRRIHVRVQDPVLEAVTGSNPAGFTPAPQVAFYGDFDGTFTVHNRSSLQNREDLIAYVSNLMTNAVLRALVRDGDEIYG